MKSSLIFFSGIIFGIVGLYVWQTFQNERVASRTPISAVTFEEALRQTSFRVTYGTTLLIHANDSDAEFQLTLSKLPNEKVRYEWSSVPDKASGGNGELFEKYEKITNSPTETRLKDIGSSLHIELDEIVLSWSAGSAESGYLYFDPKKVTITNRNKTTQH